ncbi:phage major capsid protein, P2 family [Dasania marina]|uniref:phage major capsid protein, P2 family n=1 Tax=Dasania marina TaxID=471499 RepID=UPI00037BA81D|nr:phage major capsid protein, P2 family [Dasania marina]
MLRKTALAFSIMAANIAETYEVDDVSKKFSATPSIAQELVDAITLEDGFLKLINVVPVDELQGEKVMGSANGIVPKRTNTAVGDRLTTDILNLGSKTFQLYKSEFDVHIKYSTIDSWAKFPNLDEKYGKYVRKQIALGRIMVGWHGTSAATVTDPSTYTMGEDVNKGWFQILRDYNSGAQILDEGATTSQIRIGTGGDYVNLDAAVHDCKQMLNIIHRDASDLVAIIGTDLLAEDKTQLYISQGQTPTEKERIENTAVTRTYAGLPAIKPPSHFPARGIMVTSLDNLSIYYQSSSVRRKIEDNSKRDRIEDFNSLNEGYVIEDEEKAAAFEFENVKLYNGTAWV